MIKILLIGGTGVLSSAVTKESLERGFDVTMINRGNRPIPPSVHFFKSSKDDYKAIADYIKDMFFDAIIDFLGGSLDELEKSFCLYHNHTKQFFYISSGAVYNTQKPGPFDEDAPKVLDIWPYSVGKWASECLIKELASKTDCNYTIVRPGVTYGNSRIPYGISPRYGYHWTLCARILSEKPILRWKDGKIKSSVMRVEDFAYQMVSLIGNVKAYNQAFNISGNESPTSNDVLKEVSNIINKDYIPFDITPEFYASEYPERYGEIIGGRSIDSPLDNSKISVIAPMPSSMISLHDGIKMTIDSLIANNYQNGIDWKYDGDTDRIIAKWCKINKIDRKAFNLGFVDYLGTASINNRIEYYEERYKDILFIRMLLLSKKLAKKLAKKLSFS